MAENNGQTSTIPSGVRTQAEDERLQRWRWLRHNVVAYTKEHALIPPLLWTELQHHVAQIAEALELNEEDQRPATVMLHNAVWQDIVATIPFERRVLLLPQCLRDKQTCPASMDEFGLLCEDCGACPLGRLQNEAEDLGYAVMIAEGTAPVTGLIREGRIDAAIGLSCLDTLEESFPAVVADAVPALAVPLLSDGCNNTSFDEAWLDEFLHLQSDQPPYQRLAITCIRKEVEGWFSYENLDTIAGFPDNTAARIGKEWLAKSGKRWRPLLTTAVYHAITGPPRPHHQDTPQSVQKAAVATECFHKASLIHDDIEDNDSVRYGENTLHETYGIPVALNTGDFLIGEGYRLIAECDLPPMEKNRMMLAVANAHRNLCIGQGEELRWAEQPTPVSTDYIRDIYRLKTAPAFEIALRLGAICAGLEEDKTSMLTDFTKHLGIAYQIADDIRDFQQDTTRTETLRPSLVLALLWEKGSEATRHDIQQALKQKRPHGTMLEETEIRDETDRAIVQAREFLHSHRARALNALQPLTHMELKSLLMRLVRKIVIDV